MAPELEQVPARRCRLGALARSVVQRRQPVESWAQLEGVELVPPEPKASSDGQDLLTPLVERAAEAIAAAATRPRSE